MPEGRGAPFLKRRVPQEKTRRGARGDRQKWDLRGMGEHTEKEGGGSKLDGVKKAGPGREETAVSCRRRSQRARHRGAARSTSGRGAGQADSRARRGGRAAGVGNSGPQRRRRRRREREQGRMEASTVGKQERGECALDVGTRERW